MNPAPIETEPLATARIPSQGTFTAGTLSYNRLQVIRLFGVLFWGDIAFTFFESIFSRFMPLYLKDLHASNTLIGVMTGSIAGIVNVLFLPNISQWSDSFRSRLGRRIPFLLVVTPLTVLFLVLVGFAVELGHALRPLIAPVAPGLTAEQLALGVLCGCTVLYHLFNMILVNAFNWLVRDVVPQVLMPRFVSWFRVVGNAATVLFLWYVFPHIATYRQATCLGVGIFILISFMGMCWSVKEGTYPPQTAARPNLVILYGSFFRKCLARPIYRNFFLSYLLVMVAAASSNPFVTLFASHNLNLSMATMGSYFGYATVAATILYAFMGLLCERYTSIKVTLVGLAGLAAISLVSFFAVTSGEGFLYYQLLLAIPTVAYWLGLSVITMEIFPPAMFGEMSSGMNVFGCGALIVGNYLIGAMMDYCHSDYRYFFIWCAAFYGLACLPLCVVYRQWRLHGGPSSYLPPEP